MKTCSRFRGVVVITSASHADGPRFDPGRNQLLHFVRSILIFTGFIQHQLCFNGVLRRIWTFLEFNNHIYVSYVSNGERYSLENLSCSRKHVKMQIKFFTIFELQQPISINICNSEISLSLIFGGYSSSYIPTFRKWFWNECHNKFILFWQDLTTQPIRPYWERYRNYVIKCTHII